MDPEFEARANRWNTSSAPSSSTFEPLSLTRISPDCLHIEADGTVRIFLSVSIPEWFEFLASLGDVVCIANSSVASLAVKGQAPTLSCLPDRRMARSPLEFFSPNLAEYSSLCALRELSPNGPVYLLEVRDTLGRTTQRITVPPGQPRQLYQQFVQAHQSRAKDCRPWFPANHASGTQYRAILAGRIPWLRYQSRIGSSDVSTLELHQLERLLAGALQEGLPLRTTLYNRAMACGMVWTPESQFPTAISGKADPGHLTRFFGRSAGVEFRRSASTTVWLWKGHCVCCNEEKWAVETGGEDDELVLAIAAPDRFHEQDWRDFLRVAVE